MKRTIIVPVSGGKDSQVCLSLALKEALKTGQEVVCVHQNTGYDHPDTYKQLDAMEEFYGVTIQHTRSTKYPNGMFDFIRSAGYFPNSGARGCTQRLKQEPFALWLRGNDFTPENCILWFGMRTEESKNRASKYGSLVNFEEFELQFISSFYGNGKDNKKFRLGEIVCTLPIVEWTAKNVYDYIHNEDAPQNELYCKGHTRVGCYPCLLGRKNEWILAGRDPDGREHIKELIKIATEFDVDQDNTRKYSKRVHPSWEVEHFLEAGAKEEDFEEIKGECGYCNI